MAAPLLVLKHVKKTYPGLDGGPPVEVLKGVDLQLAEGEAVAIVGPSGSGKSTLLNLAGTLDSPTSGAVIVQGRDVTALSDRERAVLRNRTVGFVFQLHYLLPQLTVLENVLVPTLVRPGADRSALQKRAERLLDRVGLGERLHHRPGELSGGERQRAAVVRALINEPALLLADEPTGSLDRRNAEALIDLLLELRREEGIALLVVTHAVDLAARLDRTLTLREGILVPGE